MPYIIASNGRFSCVSTRITAYPTGEVEVFCQVTWGGCIVHTTPGIALTPESDNDLEDVIPIAVDQAEHWIDFTS